MAGTLRLTKLKFRAGTTPGTHPLEIQPGTAVIFVGPNNAGKSLALREIESWCFARDEARKVIDSIEVDFPTDYGNAEKLLRQFESSPPPGQGEAQGMLWVGQHLFREGEEARHTQVNLDNLKDAVAQRNVTTLRNLLSSAYTVRLAGRTRFALSSQKETGDLQQPPRNHLWALFVDDEARTKVRKYTEEAFEQHFVIDPTGMHQFRIRLSPRPPDCKQEEQALDETARRFHSAAPLLQEFSDGVQAFVGLVSAVLSLPHKIILIDEPEAFLHPTIARRLGSNLARIAKERDASLVAATHSSEFLFGCLESTSQISVVRLTYEGTVATARELNSSELSTLARDPLLRSADTLRALFCRAAIVTEADSDRAFYDEMNRRLLEDHRGIGDAVFLNAQNWQTVHKIVAPLRKLGIPAAALVDLDVIKDGGTNWLKLLEGCQVPATKHESLENERKYLLERFAPVSRLNGQVDPLKHSGLSALDSGDRQRAEIFLAQLCAYGLFVVPVGELEHWLSQLGIHCDKADWIAHVFSRIGSDPTDSSYLRPDSNDVWTFLDGIAAWVNNPKRLGIP